MAKMIKNIIRVSHHHDDYHGISEFSGIGITVENITVNDGLGHTLEIPVGSTITYKLEEFRAEGPNDETNSFLTIYYVSAGDLYLSEYDMNADLVTAARMWGLENYR